MASLSTCHLGLWLGWQILLNLVKPIIPAPVWLQRMRLHFSKFDLESESSCTYDRVKIYDGSSANAQLRGSYCGNNTPGDVVSSGSTMFVSFMSDYAFTKSGFEIRYNLGESTLG